MVFFVTLTAVPRLGALSIMSSSECSVLVSDWSELCWDDTSSAMDVVARERAAEKMGEKKRFFLFDNCVTAENGLSSYLDDVF